MKVVSKYVFRHCERSEAIYKISEYRLLRAIALAMTGWYYAIF